MMLTLPIRKNITRKIFTICGKKFNIFSIKTHNFRVVKKRLVYIGNMHVLGSKNFKLKVQKIHWNEKNL